MSSLLDRHFRLSLPLVGIAIVWLVGVGAILASVPPRPVEVVHWANGHMMDRPSLLPEFAQRFNAANQQTASGRQIDVRLFRANSGEITGELRARVKHDIAIDGSKSNPTIVTPAADHWLADVNEASMPAILDVGGADTIATTYIGIVASREMAQCFGWPQREIGFSEVVQLVTQPEGWAGYACSRPEWGKEALVAFTYPNRSSTARSVLYTLYAIAAGKPPAELTVEDVSRPDVLAYVKRFQTSIDCYVPDTLDLNVKIVTNPPCAHFFFIAEDNLVKLFQGKIQVPLGTGSQARALERDMVMIYPREGSIIHNHSAFLVSADFVSADQNDAAARWVAFLREDRQQQAFMQEGFRRVTGSLCIDPLGSPFSPCSTKPATQIYPDRIDPAVAAAILRAWE